MGIRWVTSKILLFKKCLTVLFSCSANDRYQILWTPTFDLPVKVESKSGKYMFL